MPRKNRTRRRKRVKRKTGVKFPRYRNLLGPNAMIQVSRRVEPSIVKSLASSDLLGSFKFSLADCPNSTDFTNLFRAYRIDRINVSIYNVGLTTLTANINSTQAANNTVPTPCWYVAFDPTDNAVPTMAGLQSYPGVIVRSFQGTGNGRPVVKFTIKPRLSLPSYGLSTFSYGIGTGSEWVDTDYPSAEYYSLKYAIEQGGNTDNTYQIRIEWSYVMSFKNVR